MKGGTVSPPTTVVAGIEAGETTEDIQIHGDTEATKVAMASEGTPVSEGTSEVRTVEVISRTSKVSPNSRRHSSLDKARSRQLETMLIEETIAMQIGGTEEMEIRVVAIHQEDVDIQMGIPVEEEEILRLNDR